MRRWHRRFGRQQTRHEAYRAPPRGITLQRRTKAQNVTGVVERHVGSGEVSKDGERLVGRTRLTRGAEQGVIRVRGHA